MNLAPLNVCCNHSILTLRICYQQKTILNRRGPLLWSKTIQTVAGIFDFCLVNDYISKVPTNSHPFDLMTPIIHVFRVCVWSWMYNLLTPLAWSDCRNITQLKQQLCTDQCISRGTGSNQHIYLDQIIINYSLLNLSIHWRNLPILTEWNLSILTKCVLRMLGKIIFSLI